MDTNELTTYVTGSPAYKLDIMEAIQQNISFVLVFVFVVTYVILLLAFRSVLLPLKASVMNMLSLGAGLGIVVWVFQEGIGAQWHLLMAASTVVILPVIVVFFIGQRYFIEGITLTGIKG